MAQVERLEPSSPFALLDRPIPLELETQDPVRYLLVNGRQDHGVWGPIGAVWLSEDRQRGGFLVSQWAVWAGSEIIRGHRSAADRGWTPESIYRYWLGELWRGTHSIDEERHAESLALLSDLVAAL